MEEKDDSLHLQKLLVHGKKQVWFRFLDSSNSESVVFVVCPIMTGLHSFCTTRMYRQSWLFIWVYYFFS